MDYNRNKLIKTIFTIFFFLLTYSHANKEIVLATSQNEPYIGQNLPNNGYIHELVTNVFENAGYSVTIKFFPFARAKLLVQKGIVDGIIPIYSNEISKKKFILSLPFYKDNIGLFKKKSLQLNIPEVLLNNKLELLNRLKDYKFGLVRGNDRIKNIDKNDILKKEYVSEDIQNIDKLFANRIDFALIDKYTASDIMVKQRPHLIGKLEFLKPLISSKEFHLAISKNAKNSQNIINDFNKSLTVLIDNGTFETILSNHGLYNEKQDNIKKHRLVIGTVQNSDMLIMQKLSKEYEKINPQTKIEWRVMNENTLRKRLISDMAISDGQFDIMTIGSPQIHSWAKKEWLTKLKDIPNNYELNDLINPVKKSLSYKDNIFALPFYAESSMTYYRKDLFKKAGIVMPESPTYDQIKLLASKIHDPKNKIYGICLRGKAGWGANMSLINTIVSTNNGTWLDNEGNSTVNTLQWKKSLQIYKELVSKYGPKSTTINNYQENLKLFSEGNCGIWIDATVAASVLFNPKQSSVATKVGFANAPITLKKEGSHWLWVWSLAIPSSSTNKKAALDFITWATSKEYIKLVAERYGWIAVPPGTRLSTYTNEKYQKSAPFSNFVLSSIKNKKLVNKKYYYDVPEYQSIGNRVGKVIQDIIEEKISINEALKKIQEIIDMQMYISKHHK